MLYSIGHSNRTLEFFVGLLLGYNVKRLVDIRTIPRSRYTPHFNGDSLSENFKSVGIVYSHAPGLGGLRKPQKDSINRGWKHSGFRGFADYMQTTEFGENLKRLIALGEKETTAFMCAEAVSWRCHRSLISDALTIRNIPVYDIQSRVSAPLHRLTPFANVKENVIVYPPAQGELALD